jgi:hypothetical protein
MATNTTFGTMLKEYTPHSLFVDKMEKVNWFYRKLKKDQSWVGQNYIVPFEGGEYSSLSHGALTASNDVADMTPVEGSISTQPELWGTLKFQERDLERHGDLEKSFMKILPGKLNQFMERMEERISILLLNDGSVAKATADGEADGEITVDRPERFTIGEKVSVDDGNSSPVSGYVTAIDMATKKLTIKDARSSGSAVDLSGYTTAQSAKIYLPNGTTAGFTGLASQLLSSTNGGASTIFGQTKTAYPYLQAQQFSASGVADGQDLLDVFLDAMYDTQQLGKSKANSIVCSLKNFKVIAKVLQAAKQIEGNVEAGYGFAKLQMVGAAGSMEIIGLRDMPDDKAYILDWDTLVLAGSDFFKKKRHLNGEEYFIERATTGYTYIVDIKFFGDLICLRPSANGVVHSIPSL